MNLQEHKKERWRKANLWKKTKIIFWTIFLAPENWLEERKIVKELKNRTEKE